MVPLAKYLDCKCRQCYDQYSTRNEHQAQNSEIFCSLSDGLDLDYPVFDVFFHWCQNKLDFAAGLILLIYFRTWDSMGRSSRRLRILINNDHLVVPPLKILELRNT